MALLRSRIRLSGLLCAAAALFFLCGGCGGASESDALLQGASSSGSSSELLPEEAAGSTEAGTDASAAVSDLPAGADAYSIDPDGEEAPEDGSASGGVSSEAPSEEAPSEAPTEGPSVSETEPEEPTWVITPVEEAYTIYCTGAAVNVRAQPSTDGAIIGKVLNGDELTCTATVDNGWLQVQYDSGTCYVYGDYFSTEKPVIIENTSGTKADSSDFTTQSGTGIYYEGDGPLVAIDAGHQQTPDSSEEPIGPGATTTKARVSAGTEGVSSGVPEYELTLQVSLRLRDALLEKGYAVLMIRETNDVSISNAERAQLANSYNADIFLRIHANAVDVSSATGTLTMAPSLENPYCSEIAEESQILSQLLVDDMCAETGFRNRGVSITDTMSGINWCEMPVSIIEMGFMSNEKEDEAMQTAEVQQQLVDGMVKAVDEFFDR